MLAIFTIIISALVYKDYQLYKTIFTPFSLISIVYLLLILFNNTVAVNLGFYSVQNLSIIYIMYFLAIIYLLSLIAYKTYSLVSVRYDTLHVDYNSSIVYENRIKLTIIFVIGLISKYISLIQVISIYGISDIKGKAFGIFAHLGNLGLIITPFIFIIYQKYKSKLHLVLAVLMYVNLLVFGGKYGIIIAVLHTTLMISMNRKINLKQSLLVGSLMVLIGIIIFVIIYAIEPTLSSGMFTFEMLFQKTISALRHFLYYLLSPVIATNYYFSHPGQGNIEVLFTVPVNIFKAVFSLDSYISPINTLFIPVHDYYKTNVGGIFSEVIFESNIFIGTIYILVFFTFVYFVFILAKYYGIFKSFSALLLSIVLMLFFTNFLTVSGVVLPIIFLFIAELILMRLYLCQEKIK